MKQNAIEVDIKYSEGNFTEEQYFILNGNITVCSNRCNEWTEPVEYETELTDREILKECIQAFKEGVTFRGYGVPTFIKIWNLSRFK